MFKNKCSLTPESVHAALGTEGGFAFFFHATDWDTISFGLEGTFDRNSTVERGLWDYGPLIGSLINVGDKTVGVNVISPVPVELWMKNASTLRRFRDSHFASGLKLARNCGATTVALGALMPYACSYGTKKPATSPGLTTGHAATAATMEMMIHRCCGETGINYESSTIAIFGANGSLGRLMVDLLLDHPPRKLVLVEREAVMTALERRTREYETQTEIELSSYNSFKTLPHFDGALMVTNQTTPFLTREQLTQAKFWIDDSHPRACSVELEQELHGTTLYVECYLRGPNDLDVGFPFRLASSRDCYSCLAEGYVAHAEGNSGDFIVGRPTVEQVKKVGALLKKHGFSTGPLLSKSGRLVG